MKIAPTPGSVFLLWQALTALSASSLDGQITKQQPATETKKTKKKKTIKPRN